MLKKTLLVLVALIVLLLVGAQLFLQYGLTDSMRKYVLPAVSQKLAVDVSVEKIGVNLLAGSISMHGVKVANPPTFQAPHMATLDRFRIKVGIPALLKGGIAEIRKANVRDGVVTVVRHKDGALNIEPLLGLKKDIESAAAAAAAAPAVPGAPPSPATRAPVNTVIKLLEVNTLVHYTDYQLTREPFKMSLDLRARLQNVANYGDEEVLSGSVELQGALMVEHEQCAFDLHGRMAPIVDPKRVSFDVSGSMQELDLKAFQELIRRHEVEGGQVSGTATLVCKKGVFDPDKSVLRLTLKNLTLTENNSAHIPADRLPEFMKIEVPIKGTLEHPRINFDGVLEKMLLNPDLISDVLKKLTQDQGKDRGANPPAAAEAGSNAPVAPKPVPAESLGTLPNVDTLFKKSSEH